MLLNSKPHLSGLIGLNCLNTTLILMGYKVSSIETNSSGIIDLRQLLSNFSKIFRTAANLSFSQCSVLVSKSSKNILEKKHLSLFFDDVAEKKWDVRSFLKIKAPF